jgi:hypothetical protein
VLSAAAFNCNLLLQSFRHCLRKGISGRSAGGQHSSGSRLFACLQQSCLHTDTQRSILLSVVQPVGTEAAADIDKDLGRTFPSMRRFATAEGQDTLRRVLRAYAAFDPEVRS